MRVTLTDLEIVDLVELWCRNKFPENLNYLPSSIDGQIEFDLELCKVLDTEPEVIKPPEPDLISPKPKNEFDDDIPF